MDEQNTFVFTLYTIIGDFSRIAKAVTTRYEAVTKEILEHANDGAGTENLRLKLQDDTELEALIRYGNDYISQQIPGMMKYFSQAPCENKALMESILKQISVFNCIVNVQFVRTEDANRFNYLVNTVFNVAKDLTAIVLLPSMELFTSDQKRLLSIDGQTDFTEYIPVGNSDVLDQNIVMGPEDEARKQRSIAQLKTKNIPYLEHLKAAVAEAQAVTRTAEEIAYRLFALFAVCAYSEMRQDGSRQDAMKYVEKVDGLMNGCLQEYLTPREQSYLAEENPAAQDIINFSWQYERCHVLMWALGYFGPLGYPDSPCNVGKLASIIFKCKSIKSFIEKSRPRSKALLLDAADLILRYDWACVDARVKGQEVPAGLDEGVVYEWHYALNWLVGADGDGHWDQIQVNT